MFINVPNQQPDGQLQKRHVIQTLIIEDNKQGTKETHTYKTNDRIPKSVIRIPYDIKPTIETVCENLPFQGI
jgi:hypothetical protein